MLCGAALREVCTHDTHQSVEHIIKLYSIEHDSSYLLSRINIKLQSATIIIQKKVFVCFKYCIQKTYSKCVDNTNSTNSLYHYNITMHFTIYKIKQVSADEVILKKIFLSNCYNIY